MENKILIKHKVSNSIISLKRKIEILEKENRMLKKDMGLKGDTKEHISVLDNIPLALINLDINGNFMFSNAFFYSLFDLEPGFLDNKTNIVGFSPLWGTNLFEHINSLIKFQKSFDCEVKLKYTGSDRIYKARGLSIKNKDDVIQSFLIIIGDITQRKKAENQLIHEKERAEESDRLKTAFIANISHEIRTPINHIMGFLELLSMDDLDYETRNEYRGIIHSSSQSLLNSIENIIDIARIKTGQVQLKSSLTDVNELLDSIEESAKEIVKKNNKQSLRIIKSIPPNSEGFTINIDSKRLKQILKNLVENAIKFTYKGSVDFGYKASLDGNLYFYVKDTGIGINKEDFKTIFDSFRQIDYRTTRVVEGSGIGLAISQGLAELMDAKLEIRSVVDKGSVFSLHFRKIKCNFNQRDKGSFPKEIFDAGF